jgi:hypothetical protein
LGIGDWGLGIGDWGLGKFFYYKFYKEKKYYNKLVIFYKKNYN